MNTSSKMRLGAIAVILNGFAAFAVLSPQTAQATSCPQYGGCNFCFVSLADCQRFAPPGCTAVSYSCIQGGCGPYQGPLGLCKYQ